MERTPPEPAATVLPATDPLFPTVMALVMHQRNRRFCIVSQSRIDRAVQSHIARALGYDPKAPEAERKAVFKTAGNIVKAVEAGKDFPPPFPADDPRWISLRSFVPLIPISAASRAAWDHYREEAESEMRKLAQQLPVWPWVQENAKGVGALGLARLVAEAPLIGRYPTYGKLWKRFGVAVIAGERQQKKQDEVEAALHGYVPKRRAELWSVCSDTMFRQQWRGAGNDPDDPETQGYPIGAYGEAYRQRKAATLPRIAETADIPFKNSPRSKLKWTPKRCDQDARRVMSKEFLMDLWLIWQGREAVWPARWKGQQEAA